MRHKEVSSVRLGKSQLIIANDSTVVELSTAVLFIPCSVLPWHGGAGGRAGAVNMDLAFRLGGDKFVVIMSPFIYTKLAIL